MGASANGRPPAAGRSLAGRPLTCSYDIAIIRTVRLTAAPDVTSGGRHAALVFTRRGDKLRPISCRAMRKGEKEAYDAAT